MRAKLVQQDLVECVIGLGANLFYNSPMEACIMICRTKKPAERQGKVLFVNAVDLVERKNAESYLTDEHISKIAEAYLDYRTIDGLSGIIDSSAIRDNNYSLNISLYVRNPQQAVNVVNSDLELQQIYENWKKASSDMQTSYIKLNKLLKEAAHE